MRAKPARGRRHRPLDFQGNPALFRFDVLVKCEVEASPDPRGHRRSRGGGCGHLCSQAQHLIARHLPKDRRNQLILRFEMSVESAGAELGAIQDRGDAEPLDSLLTDSFRRDSHDGTTHIGVRGELVSPARGRTARVSMPTRERVPLIRHQ